MLALDAGLINVTVIAHGESARSRVGAPVYTFPPDSIVGQFELPFGVHGPASLFSLTATRHTHEYGTTREQMAEVAVANRKWAAMHPKALMRDPISIGDVMASRMICWPFSVLMCCVVTDAGGALFSLAPPARRTCDSHRYTCWARFHSYACSRRSGILRPRRERCVRVWSTHRTGWRFPHEHQWGRPFLYTLRHVRHARADRTGAAVAR